MTCRELIEFLLEYVEGELDPVERARFDRHLTLCPGCVAYLETYRQTIRAGKAVEEPACEAIPEDLVKAILAARAK